MKKRPVKNSAIIMQIIEESRKAGFTRISGSSPQKRKEIFMLSLGLDKEGNPINEGIL